MAMLYRWIINVTDRYGKIVKTKGVTFEKDAKLALECAMQQSFIQLNDEYCVSGPYRIILIELNLVRLVE